MVTLDRLAHAARRAASARGHELRFALRAWALAPAVEVSLALFGVRRTLDLAAHVPIRLGARTEGGGRAVSVGEGKRWVDRAYAVHLLKGRCLPRSLVQHVAHRLDGTSSRLVIGVRSSEPQEGWTSTIDAHAWVETDGEVPTEAIGFKATLILDRRGVARAAEQA